MKPRRFDEYLLVDRISAGGMAEVYLAKSNRVFRGQQIVAIKRILPIVAEDEDFRTMFIDEGLLSKRLKHENIGEVFDLGLADREYFIAMEYISGRDLRQIRQQMLDRGQQLPIAFVLHVLSRVCQALDYAHRQRGRDGKSLEIVHRDVSPPNVLISYGGKVKLIDFGIARATSRLVQTLAGKLKGKFAYMSPEQVEGREIDQRSDIFTCGTLLYELLTHRRPFRGAHQMEVLQAIRRAEFDPPSRFNPAVDEAIDAVVLKALARDPDHRYSWASEMRADIERYLARSELSFGTQELAEWMHDEFGDEYEAERLMLERVQQLEADVHIAEATPLAVELPEAALSATASRGGRALMQGDRSYDAPDEQASTNPDSPMLHTSAMAEEEDAIAGDTDQISVAALAADPRFVEPAFESSPSIEPGGDTDPGRTDFEAPDTNIGDPISAAGEAPRPLDQQTRQLEHVIAELSESDNTGAVAIEELVRERSEAHDLMHAAIEPSDSLAREERAVEGAQAESAVGQQQRAAPDWSDVSEEPGDEVKQQEERGEPTRIDAPPSLHILDSSSVEAAPPLASAEESSQPPSTAAGAVDVDSDPELPSADQRRTKSQTNVVSWTNPIRLALGRLTSTHLILVVGAATFVLVGGVVLMVMLLVGGGASRGSSTGAVEVKTVPSASCSVLVDGRSRGLITPGGSLKLVDVPAGEHRIELQCHAFRPYRRTLKVEQGKTVEIWATIEP